MLLFFFDNLIYRIIDYRDIPQTTMLVHTIDNIMQIRPGWYKVARNLGALVKYSVAIGERSMA